MPRLLVVNADDFGFTHGVNAGIVEAHTQGILTATTLMANGAAFADAVQLAQQHPTLDVGCHLVLVGGESVHAPGTALPRSVSALGQAIYRNGFPVYQELQAQMRKIADAGIRPTHLDTHKHTHLLPAVLQAVLRVAQEFGVNWIRRPYDSTLVPTSCPVPWQVRVVSGLLRYSRPLAQRQMQAAGCRTTDHFTGFQMTGRFTARHVVELLQALPEGVTEFMTHPGRHTAELEAAPTRLKASRARELAALTAPEVRQAVQTSGVRLVRFGEL